MEMLEVHRTMLLIINANSFFLYRQNSICCIAHCLNDRLIRNCSVIETFCVYLKKTDNILVPEHLTLNSF